LAGKGPRESWGAFWRPLDFDSRYKQLSKNALAAYQTLQLFTVAWAKGTIEIIENSAG